MRFGLFTTLYDCGGGAETPADVLDNVREQVVLAEELGYDAVWMGEHHFGPYDLGDLPNPILVGADLAVRTSRIRIGQMANIAPWWHPIRLAEDLAILDNLTRGRVDVGFGRGIWPTRGRSSTRTPTRDGTRRIASSSARPSTSCGRPGPRSASPTQGRTIRFRRRAPGSPIPGTRRIPPGRTGTGSSSCE